MSDDITFTGWRKSSLSFSNGNCVEAGAFRVSSRSGGNGACLEAGSCRCGVAVRDTKLAESPILKFSGEAWRRFTSAVKLGTAAG